MKSKSSRWRVFAANERAGTVVEYTIVAAGIALAVVGGMSSLSQSLQTTFNNIFYTPSPQFSPVH